MGKRYIAEDGSPAERRMHLFRIPWRRGRMRTAASLGDSLFQWLAGGVAVAVVALLALIVVVLFIVADDSIRTFGIGFLNGTIWNPVPPEIFGAVPFVYGTLVTSALALLFGVPISLGIAIFLSELAPRWLRVPLTYVVELLAAVPSVVYGLWGIFVLSPVMRAFVEPVIQDIFGFLPIFQGNPIGTDKFTAGVIRAVILGLGRAVGETMAVTMTIGNRNAISVSLFDQGQTIASWIANNFTEAGPLELSALIELGLVLMLMSLAINIFARLMVRRVMGVGEAA